MRISIAQALQEAAIVLRNAGVPEARREAGSLLTAVVARDRTFIITHDDTKLSEMELERFGNFVQRRAEGEPQQYIIGVQDFYGRAFRVTPDVLIPRPETEILVENALLRMTETFPTICDVGTGSGCIAISLLCERRDARATGLDISSAALAIARENSHKHEVDDRLSLVISDCFASLTNEQRFDVIVSNPPYVSAESLNGLQREVREHEPKIALSPGPDGLSIIRRLIREAPRFLRPGGWFIFEMGFDQGAQVQHIIDKSVWQSVELIPDLQLIPRIAALQAV